MVLCLVGSFMRRKEDGKPGMAQRILSGVLSFSTVILIATAISKMLLYIDQFGLTRKRVYTTWFMILLGVCFIFVIIKQFRLKLNTAACFLFSFIILFSVLVLSGVDGIIARSNAERYINGDLDYFDAYAMEELGDAAVPSLIKVVEYLESKGIESDRFSFNSVLKGEHNDFITLNRGSTLIFEDTVESSKRNALKNGGVLTEKEMKMCEIYARALSVLGRQVSHSESRESLFSLTLPRIRAERAISADTE